MLRTRLAALALAGALGCGAAQSGAPEDADRLSPSRLYPLALGTVWTYDVDTGESVKVLAISRVVAEDGARVQVSSGSEPVTYERRPEGLFRPDRGGWLLKAPVRLGATWDAGAGVTAEVAETEVTVSTEAGSFRDCVAVEETGGATPKRVRTVYCPDVGPVVVESGMALGLTGGQAQVKAVLRGYALRGL